MSHFGKRLRARSLGMAEETLELSPRDAVDAVKNNGTLTTLTIPRLGGLDDAAGTALGEALKTNSTLTILAIYLNSKQIMEPVGKALGEALQENQAIVELTTNVPLSSEAVLAVARNREVAELSATVDHCFSLGEARMLTRFRCQHELTS